MMKKILSIVLIFSLAMQPMYGAIAPIKRAREQWSQMKEAVSRGRTALQGNMHCLISGKGQGCTEDKHLALLVIRNFVTGNMQASKEGIGKLLHKHWNCWKSVLKGMGIPLVVVAKLFGLSVVDVATIKAPQQKPQPTPVKTSDEKTFIQKLKATGNCLIVIGVDIAILAALIGIIKVIINRRHKEKIALQGEELAKYQDLLRWSIEKQNDENVLKILNAISFKPADLNNMLIIAVQFGTDIAVKKLLDSGASAKFIDGLNTSLLHHVSVRAGPETMNEYERQDRAKIIDELIKRGAPINHQSGEVRATALMQAAQTHNQWLIEKLLKAGADKTLKDKDNETAYDYAKRTNAPDNILNLLYPNSAAS